MKVHGDPLVPSAAEREAKKSAAAFSVIAMAANPDIDKFDDVDEPVWDINSVVTPSPVKELTPEQIKAICDHKRRVKRIEAIKKVALAAIASLPVVIAMLR